MNQQSGSAFCIDQVCMVLGKAATPVAALNLDILPAEQQYISWQQQQLAASFVLPVNALQSQSERLCALLELLFAQMSEQLIDKTVYLVLPEFTGVDNQQLNAFLQHLMRHFPNLLRSETCKVFPYGCAGALMALSAAQQQLQQDINAQIWLVSVDTAAVANVLHSFATKDCAAEPSEGAIAFRLSRASDGLAVVFIASDASVAGDAEADQAVAALFQQLASTLSAPLDYLYLPDCGDLKATDRWLAQYHYLHGVVNENTEHVFASYNTGELGASGGLYRLIHIYRAYQRGYIEGTTLQCELSPTVYRAVAVFHQAGTLVHSKDV